MQNDQTFRPYIKSASAFVLLWGAILLDGYLWRQLMVQSRQDHRKPEQNAVLAGTTIGFVVVTFGIVLALRYCVKQHRQMKPAECLIPDGVEAVIQSKLNLNKNVSPQLARLLHQDEVNIVELLNAVSAADGLLQLTKLFLSTKTAVAQYTTQLSHEHNFTPVALRDVKNTHLAALQKKATHECILTIVWLAVGGFGWELFYMYSLMLTHYSSMDVMLDGSHWNKKLFLWLSAGLGSYIFLIAGMALGHIVLSNCFGGRPVNESYFQMKQFFISVTIADGLWMLFTGLPRVICQYEMIQGVAADVLAPTMALGFYLMESFLFKNLQNALNVFHRNDDQARWECDNAYTAILWANYWGFNVVAGWLRQAMGVSAESTHAGEIILIALAGGLGAALPALLIHLGLIFEHLQEVKAVWSRIPSVRDIEEAAPQEMTPVVENAGLKEKLLSPSDNGAQQAYKFSGFAQSALIFLSRSTVAVVQLAEDICPSAKIFSQNNL